MLKFFVVAMCFFSAIALAAKPQIKPASNRFRKTLVTVECVDKKHPDTEKGDQKLRNKSYGRYKIRKPYADDINLHFGTKWRAEDCLGHPEVSDTMLDQYMAIWATVEHLGHEPTPWDMFCLHNGGPTGPFSDGVIDCRGTIEKDPDRREVIARNQARAEIYAKKAMAVYDSLSDE